MFPSRVGQRWCCLQLVVAVHRPQRFVTAPGTSLLLAQRLFATRLSRPLLCSSRSLTGAHSTTNHGSGVEGAEDEGVLIFRPEDDLSPDQKERRQKTDNFIRVVLTTGDEQEWRDMLAAALRYGTWREHHLQTLLRGVRLLKYDSPPALAVEATAAAGNGGGHDEANEKGAFGASREVEDTDSDDSSCHSGHAAPSRATQRSTPTQRLGRVKEALMFLADEGEAAHFAGADKNEDDEWGGKGDGENGSGNASVLYRPGEASVHNLLTQLLRGAQHHHHSQHGQVTPTAADPSFDALPHALYTDVWSFLAWMELHDYHVLSVDLLSELEAVVDLDEAARDSCPTGAGGSNPSVPPSQQRQPLQYAAVSRRVNRLEYLRQEKERLLKRERVAGETASSATRTQKRGGQRRAPVMPRTEPDL